MEGDFFMNTITSSLSELTAYILSGIIMSKLGPKLSYFLSFTSVAISCVIYLGIRTSSTAFVPLVLLAASFGTSSALNIDWNSNALLFPVIYSSSTNGICNLFARLSTIVSP